MDHHEKWKISKKELGTSHCSNSSASSSSKSVFSRSFSTKSSSSKPPLLIRSSSVSAATTSSSSSSSSTSSSLKCPLPRSGSQKGPSISRKYSSLAKEQKARFYIMRRCVAMLVCWHKHGEP